MIGTTLGRYQILEPLGEGGMGRVFLAEDPALGRRVAVKVLPPEFTHDRDRRERLLHEARAASALNHPNILVIHDLGEHDGALYVAMERIDGVTLREWSRVAPRSPNEVLSLIRQAAKALVAAHGAGLVHRDLKPENLMVRRDGLLKILDFGLARSVSPGTLGRTATLPGVVVGTAPYMSPEQVLGQAAGPASDLFSLGTILYELLAGRHPFVADSAVEIMHRILHETPEPPSRVNRSLTTDFDFVLMKALSKDPRRRHGSAHDLDVDLETLECGCGPAETARVKTTESPEGARAIAVLPFKNIGGNPDLDYIGIGLADAVITRLSTSPDLIVRATSTVAPYQNRAVDPRRVGAELEVSAVLDASFQRVGDRFRATARLVESPGGRALWAGKVDLRFEDIFEVQDQVAQGIAEALEARVSTPRPAARPATSPPPEAYELYLRAREALRAATRVSRRSAIESLERAVRIAPDYARGWAELGSAYHGMTDGGYDPDPIWYQRSEEALTRALALDPDDQVARFTWGTLLLVRGQKREAYREFAQSLKRMPNVWLVCHYFTYLFRLCDMLEEAVQASDRAFEIDPSAAWSYWAHTTVHMLRREQDLAREWLEKARLRFPGHPRIEEIEVHILCSERRFAEALARVGDLAARSEPTGTRIWIRAFCLVQVGDRDAALPLLQELEAFAQVDMDSAAHAATLHAHLGNRNQAFALLDRAVALGNDSLAFYTAPDLLDPLHEDSRWKPFLQGVERRVAEYRREFSWPPV
jgi:serine/threonine-protein kinase